MPILGGVLNFSLTYKLFSVIIENMAYKITNDITILQKVFLAPSNPFQRQYEALRAFYLGNESSAAVAQRFGFSPGYFRILCHQFRNKPEHTFFRSPQPGRKPSPDRPKVRDLIVGMRKKYYSVYDIQAELEILGHKISTPAIGEILESEGFARLMRRDAQERPFPPHVLNAEVADVRKFEWKPRRFSSRVAGIFLLMPYLLALDLDAIVKKSHLPGTKMIPATHAVRSALALKLIGTERKSHVSDLIFDQGLALFSGMNTSPKKSYLSEYSGRLDRRMDLRLLTEWLASVRPAGLIDESSFNLDFHSVPFFGEEEFIEKHYVSQRSRRQKSVLTFFAQDSGSKVFCYFNADLLKGEENDEVLAFVKYWEKTTGKKPQHLVFDSKLTTYVNLNRLDKMRITFMTLRRRDKKVLADVSEVPASAWQKVHLELPQRKFQTPRVFEKMVALTGYKGDMRQLYIQDLGHDYPTILLTNDMKSTTRQLITRYAQRMLIENSLAESVDFFHLDALSSAVLMKVDFDVLLTVIASGLYRNFAKELRGFGRAKARQLFRRFIDTPGEICVDEDGATILFPKRAHNPLLSAAGFFKKEMEIPWWSGKKLRLRQA